MPTPQNFIQPSPLMAALTLMECPPLSIAPPPAFTVTGKLDPISPELDAPFATSVPPLKTRETVPLPLRRCHSFNCPPLRFIVPLEPLLLPSNVHFSVVGPISTVPPFIVSVPLPLSPMYESPLITTSPSYSVNSPREPVPHPRYIWRGTIQSPERFSTIPVELSPAPILRSELFSVFVIFPLIFVMATYELAAWAISKSNLTVQSPFFTIVAFALDGSQQNTPTVIGPRKVKSPE